MRLPKPRRRRALVALLASALLGCAIAPPPPIAPTPPRAGEHAGMAAPSSGTGAWAGRSFREGLVAASHPLAAEAGAAILERGGNAVDAAAAVQFALNVVEPQFSGIGGGFFMLVHVAKTGETVVLDARERAPAAATPDMFAFAGVDADRRFAVASTSGVSVGVPGTVLGIETALARWGTMPLAATVEPAIALAEQGFAVNRFLAQDIAAYPEQTTAQPETAAVFRPGGTPLRDGDRLVQKDLARTLRLLAREGSAVFYRGEIAHAIVEAQKRSRTPRPDDGRGRMTPADLAGYAPTLREPLRGRYRGLEVVTMPPPSSGGLALLQSLAMLGRFPLDDPGQGFGFPSAPTLHVTIEALRLAFADRAKWVGDPQASAVPARGLLAPAYLAERGALIDPDRRMPTPAAGHPPSIAGAPQAGPAVHVVEHGGHTTHFTIADRHGNVVAVTSTIENGFGTGITVPGYGFLLNNELTDFNLQPVAGPGDPGANDAGPGRIPRSSMAPTMLFRGGRPVAAYGSPGGPTIISTVLLVTENLVDQRMLMQDAIDAPRIAVLDAAGALICDGPGRSMQKPIAIGVQDALRALGHPLRGAPGTDACTSSIGSVQGALIDPASGRLYGGADARREGTVIGLPRPR